eukprot:361151-Chlamydomonas_euryale.AAC.5
MCIISCLFSGIGAQSGTQSKNLCTSVLKEASVPFGRSAFCPSWSYMCSSSTILPVIPLLVQSCFILSSGAARQCGPPPLFWAGATLHTNVPPRCRYPGSGLVTSARKGTTSLMNLIEPRKLSQPSNLFPTSA